jgi:hypothetical protein
MVTRQLKKRCNADARSRTLLVPISRLLIAGCVAGTLVLTAGSMQTDSVLAGMSSGASDVQETTGEVALLVPRKIRFIIRYQRVKTA